MPRLTQATPKYRKHRASGQAIVTIAGDDHYLGPHNSRASKAEYDRLIGEWLAAGQPTSRKREAEDITVTEVLARFVGYAKQRYQRDGQPTKRYENYRRVVKEIRLRYGHTMVSDFGPLALKALRASFVESGANRRTANEYTQMMRSIFRWAASEQLIPAAIPHALDTVDGLRHGETDARESTPVMPVAERTVGLTLPHLPPIVADMVRIQRLTGARPGEVCAMRPCDIDCSGEVWTYKVVAHKTQHFGYNRVIYVGPKAQAILAPYLRRAADAYCFSPAEAEQKRREQLTRERKTPWSCGNTIGANRKTKPAIEPGKCYTNASYRRAIARACEIAFGMPENLRFPERQKARNDGPPQRMLRRLYASRLADGASEIHGHHINCGIRPQLIFVSVSALRRRR
jgi:integrase